MVSEQFSLLQAADLPMPTLFLLFLSLFVLIGLIPFFQQIAARRRRSQGSSSQLKEASEVGARGESGAIFARPDETLEIYDFEVMVLRRLALAGRKGLSLKTIAGDLHLGPSVAVSALASLSQKGLVHSAPVYLVGNRFFLSKRGREYAVRQGLLPATRRSYGRTWP